MAGAGSRKISVGHKIRAAREFKEMSQEYLANKLGISQPALSKIENNETKLDFEKIEQIASILGVEVDDMLNFDKANVFNNCNQSGTFSGVNNSFTFTGEELRNVYDKLLEEKDKRIQLLEQLLKDK